jgi:hypothetical protein
MPTTTQLREMEHAHWALVFVVEDFPYAWSTNRELEGTGFFDDGRQVLGGLHPPSPEMAIDAYSDFQFKRTATEIAIEDFDGRLAEMLAGFDGSEETLFPSVLPTDDLAARTELHGMQVGNEAIGPDGERNVYPAIPGFSRPRLHIGEDYELDEVAAAPVSPRPVILEGRRVVLYRVYRDHVTYPPPSPGFSSWRPVAEAERIWWGTLRKAGHDIDGREWKLQCDGPESWIYTRLGMLSQERPVRVWAPMVLDDTPGADETRVRVTFRGAEGPETNAEEYGEDFYATAITANDTIGLRAEVGALIVSVATTVAGGTGIFTAFHGQTITVNVANGEVAIRIDNEATSRYAQLTWGMHEKAWKRWGVDPAVQNALAEDDELYIEFVRNDVSAPGPGYWEAIITTKAKPGFDSEQYQIDNDGLPRVWKPLYPGGTMVLEPGSGQVLNLGDDIVHHSGQHDRPPLGDPDDPTSPYPLGSGVNRHGYWLIWGPRRFAGVDANGETLEDFEEVQVVEASWREPTQDLAQVAGDPPQIVVQRWLAPRRFGIDRPRLTSAWVALQNDERTVYARPLLRLGYTPHTADPEDGDQAHLVIQRLLYTTGQTPGWVGYEGGAPTLAATANEPAGVPAGLRLDAEHEDLGCAVPASMIRAPAHWTARAERLSDALRRISLVITPGMETESLFRGLMTPRGWGWSLDGGQYGLLDITETLSPAGAIALDYRRKRTGNANLRDHTAARQQGRAFAPKDKYTLRFDWSPKDESFGQQLSQRSPDRGSRYRPYPGDDKRLRSGQSTSEHIAEAHGSRNAGGWVERQADVARWYDRGQFWLERYSVMRRPGQDLWLGTKVVLAEPRAANPSGTYGVVGAVGIITRAKAVRGGDEFEVDVLVDAASTTRLRINAPRARARGYNPATRELIVDDDWLEVGGDHIDAEHFVEPSWSSLGGDAVIQVRQWSGAGWRVTCSGTVESVVTTPGSCRIVLTEAGLAGTYYRDDDAVVTLHPTQTAAWVLAFFSPICDEDGTWGPGDAPGYPWM